MLRTILLAIAGLYLIAVGLWPTAAAPVHLLFAGLAVLVGLVPGAVWALVAVVVWLVLKDRPAPTRPATA